MSGSQASFKGMVANFDWNMGRMMKFLNEVKTSDLKTFPITLTMVASASGDGMHMWTVIFVV